MNAPQGRPMGLVRDMPFEEYLAIDAFSASTMRAMARSPWHYRNGLEKPPTRAMLNGSLVHCAQLEPDALASRYVVVPADAPRRPTAAQWAAKKPSPDSVAAMAWWTEFAQQAGTRQIVRAEDYAITQQQLAALRAEPYLAEIFGAVTVNAEASVFWVDQATGVYCKARPDWLHWTGENRVRVLELKSTADESPEGFSRTLTTMGYHRARAHYIAGVEAATGATVEEYVFAVVSSAPPVLAVAYWLDDEDADQGAEECAELRQRFAWCLRNDQWPAYGDGPQIVGLMKWAKRDNEVEVDYAD